MGAVSVVGAQVSSGGQNEFPRFNSRSFMTGLHPLPASLSSKSRNPDRPALLLRPFHFAAAVLVEIHGAKGF